MSAQGGTLTRFSDFEQALSRRKVMRHGMPLADSVNLAVQLRISEQNTTGVTMRAWPTVPRRSIPARRSPVTR